MSASTSQANTLLRRTSRALLFIGATAMLLIASSIVFIDSLARLVAAPLLSNYGVELQELSGLRIRMTQISADSLRLRLTNSDMSSHIENLRIQFGHDGLLRGQLQAVHARAVSITLSATTLSAPAAQPGTTPALPSAAELIAALESIPGAALSIDTLDIAPYVNGGTLTIRQAPGELHSQISSQQSAASIDLHWAAAHSKARPTGTPAYINANFTISYADERVLRSEFTLGDSHTGPLLTSTNHVVTPTLQALLDDWDLMPGFFESLNGEAHFDLALSKAAPSAPGYEFVFSAPAQQTLGAVFNTDNALALNSATWRNEDTTSLQGQLDWPRFELRFDASAGATQLIFTNVGSNASTRLDLALEQFTLRCVSTSHCTGSHASNIRLDSLASAEFELSALLAISSGTFELDEGRSQLQLAQGSRLELGTVSLADFTASDVNVLVQEQLTLDIDAGGDALISSTGVDVYLPDINSAGTRSHLAAAFSDLEARYSATNADNTHVEAHIQLRNIGSDSLPVLLRKPEAEFFLQAHAKQVHVQGALRVADRDILALNARFNPQDNSGRLSVETPQLTFDETLHSLDQLIFHAPFDANIVAGSARASADLDVRRNEAAEWQVHGPVSFSADRLSGYYEDTAVIALSTQLRGELHDTGEFTSAGLMPLSIARIDVGLPIENIALHYGIDSARTRLELTSLEASLFAGTVHSTGLVYDWSASSNSMILNIERLNLARMLDMAAYDGVQATGLINGTIPITLTGTAPSVAQGRLEVEAPGGVIRYLSAPGSSGNSTLDFVNQALSNYQYDLMETTVDYLPTGELQLGVRLQGLNPDVSNAQRIHLNLNISDNILMLLQSLQAGRSVSDALERQMQSR